MYLYVLKTKDARWYKIGISYAPLGRMQELQIANPQELELVASFQRDDAPADELWLHQALRPFHLRGEWFHLPDGIAASLIAGDWSHFGVLERLGQVDPVACCTCFLCTEMRVQKCTQPHRIPTMSHSPYKRNP